MQDQRIEEERPEDHLSEPDRDSAVLDLMLCDPLSYPWTVEELVREMQERCSTMDSIRRLTESGLVHRLGEFVFPTRTARRAAEIQIGTV